MHWPPGYVWAARPTQKHPPPSGAGTAGIGGDMELLLHHLLLLLLMLAHHLTSSFLQGDGVKSRRCLFCGRLHCSSCCQYDERRETLAGSKSSQQQSWNSGWMQSSWGLTSGCHPWHCCSSGSSHTDDAGGPSCSWRRAPGWSRVSAGRRALHHPETETKQMLNSWLSDFYKPSKSKNVKLD